MMQQNVNQQTTAMRKPSGPQRAQKQASMTTEYRERFLPPHCRKVVTTTSPEKGPYHALKGTSADVTTLKSFYVTHKWIKRPPKAPQPSLKPKRHQTCSGTAHCFKTDQTKVEDYTSVYQSDFQAWKGNKRRPYNQVDSLNVNQGLVGPSNEGRCKETSVPAAAHSEPVPQAQEPKPFGNITSYRSDFVAHPVQPRTRSEKPVHNTRGLLSLKPTVAWERNQERFDEASVIFQQFKTWSLETKVARPRQSPRIR